MYTFAKLTLSPTQPNTLSSPLYKHQLRTFEVHRLKCTFWLAPKNILKELQVRDT